MRPTLARPMSRPASPDDPRAPGAALRTTASCFRRCLGIGSTTLAALAALTLATPLIAESQAASAKSEPVFLEPGEVVKPFEAQGIDGTAHTVDFPKGTTTILLFFSSGCPHCHKMIPEWNRRFETRAGNLAIIGVIVDNAPDAFFKRVSIMFPVLRSPGPQLLQDFKVARVPIMLRVAPGGKVEEVAVGEVDRIRLGQIFRP